MLVISRIECFQVPHDDGQHVGRSQKVISEIFLTRLLATKVRISADTWLRSYGHTPTDWILITPALTAPLTIRIGPISDYPLDNTSDLSQSSWICWCSCAWLLNGALEVWSSQLWEKSWLCAFERSLPIGLVALCWSSVLSFNIVFYLFVYTATWCVVNLYPMQHDMLFICILWNMVCC